MTGVRGTKRRLDLDSGSPGPAETSTSDLTFQTAQERTLPAVSGMVDDDDLTEVSSPARPTAVSKITRQVERLHEGEQRRFWTVHHYSTNTTATPCPAVCL